MENRIFVLEGLDCANCAQKIEDRVNKINGVKKATLNFINKKLIVEFSVEQNEELINQIKSTITSIEPDVKIIEFNDNTTKIKDDKYDESNKTLKRLFISLLFFILGITLPFNEYLKYPFFLASYLIAGIGVLKASLNNIKAGEVFDENFLMSVATLGAIAIGQFEEAIAVMIFYEIGEYFQSKAVNQSRKSIAKLMDIRPDYANLIENEDFVKVNPKDVKIGDYILIKPGEKVPLDSIIIDGESSMDTKALTGESMPKDVKTGDEILGGYINLQGLLKAKVEKEYKESSVSKILKLVEEASEKKAPTENFITVFSKYYTPVVVFLAIGLAIIPPLFIEGALFKDWIYRALVFLVVSCPCALVISIPLGFFAGIGKASKNGILIKGGNFLEALNFVDTVVFDKTGTLTEGVFKVSDVFTVGNYSIDEILYFAAYAEYNSNHPIAKSIIEHYKKEINLSSIEEFKEYAGNGIEATVNNSKILLGKIDFLKSKEIEIDEKYQNSDSIYIAIDGNFEGYIVITDKIKDDAKYTIDTLKKNGIKNIVMLTGDNEKTASKIAFDLGIDSYYANLLPDDKVDIAEKLMNRKSTKNSKMVFVGDGINDAPVLSIADVGIAMGGLGSDAAIEASDIVLMTDELKKLIELFQISSQTRKIVYENIYLSLSIKFLVLILGAFGITTMWHAVFADVGVTILAVANSMRLLKNK
ncbi:cadmium-translocating P-type ATPase [Soehngenia saccharolytica]|nr:cadmium-translocating P-type ATPase [Soehngenia saccharolytica]